MRHPHPQHQLRHPDQAERDPQPFAVSLRVGDLPERLGLDVVLGRTEQHPGQCLTGLQPGLRPVDGSGQDDDDGMVHLRRRAVRQGGVRAGEVPLPQGRS